MPATSPRIAVSLPPEVYALYKAFAQVSKQSMSSMLAEIAVTSAPALERVLRIAVAAKEAEESRKEGMRAAFEMASQSLQEALRPVESALGASMDQLELAATGKAPNAQRGAARAARTPDPRPSNYGGQHPNRKSRKPKKGG